MSTEERARREEQLAELQEDTEARMHSVAEVLPDSAAVHERANRVSEHALKHYRHAKELRDDRS